MDLKTKKAVPPISHNTLSDIQKLITDLNSSLLELKKEKDKYRSNLTECRGLCHQIRELMDATTTRITKSDRD
jgi:hypothetical protein